MVVISGARALRHPSQMAAVLPAAAPSHPNMHIVHSNARRYQSSV